MKTAIFLRGHARTWNTVKYQNLSFLNECYDCPDWYVLMPFSKTVTLHSLHMDFYKNNLIHCNLINESNFTLPFIQIQRWDNYCPEYWKLAWLDYQLSIALRQHEIKTGSVYDQILFARPDCAYKYTQYTTSAEVAGSMNILTMFKTGATGLCADQSDPEILEDLCYVAGRAAAGLLMMRYLDSQWQDLPNQLIHPSPSALLAYYCMKHSIVINESKRFIHPTLARPQYIGYTEWSKLDTQSKIDTCGEFNIDPNDYQLLF